MEEKEILIEFSDLKYSDNNNNKSSNFDLINDLILNIENDYYISKISNKENRITRAISYLHFDTDYDIINFSKSKYIILNKKKSITYFISDNTEMMLKYCFKLSNYNIKSFLLFLSYIDSLSKKLLSNNSFNHFLRITNNVYPFNNISSFSFYQTFHNLNDINKEGRDTIYSFMDYAYIDIWKEWKEYNCLIENNNCLIEEKNIQNTFLKWQKNTEWLNKHIEDECLNYRRILMENILKKHNYYF